MRYLFLYALYHWKSDPKPWSHIQQKISLLHVLKFRSQFSKYWVSFLTNTRGHRAYASCYLSPILCESPGQQWGLFWSSSLWDAMLWCLTYETVRIAIGNRELKIIFVILGIAISSKCKKCLIVCETQHIHSERHRMTSPSFPPHKQRATVLAWLMSFPLLTHRLCQSLHT